MRSCAFSADIWRPASRAGENDDRREPALDRSGRPLGPRARLRRTDRFLGTRRQSPGPCRRSCACRRGRRPARSVVIDASRRAGAIRDRSFPSWAPRFATDGARGRARMRDSMPTYSSNMLYVCNKSKYCSSFMREFVLDVCRRFWSSLMIAMNPDCAPVGVICKVALADAVRLRCIGL